MLTYYDIYKNCSYFCSINVINFSHKLTLKTVDITIIAIFNPVSLKVSTIKLVLINIGIIN